MKTLIRCLIAAIIVPCLLVFSSTTSHALLPISGNMGNEGLGSFMGTIDYNFTNPTTAQLQVSLTNNSPAGNGGFLTAFAFNNPSNLITGVTTFTPSDADFGLFGGPTFNNSVNGAPYGQYDFGAGVGPNFQGGTSALGIGVGNTENFLFVFSGNNLNTLTDQLFVNTLSAGPGDGEGNEDFLTRFKGFNDEGSDHVPNDGPVIPEPSTMLLFSSGLLGAFVRRRRRS